MSIDRVMMVHSFSYLPCHEADCLYDGWLNDFLARENTPCDSVRTVRVSIGSEVAALIYNIVCDVAVAFNVGEEDLQQLGVDEKFEIGLQASSLR